MSEFYEEIFEGVTQARLVAAGRHELICAHLHQKMAAVLQGLADLQMLAPRSAVRVADRSWLRPDLAVVTRATGQLFLAVEIISREDHQFDTVTKKEIYERAAVPRLWLLDPRYDNVEVYHHTPWGLALRGILAGRELVEDPGLPGFQAVVEGLFAPG